MKKKTSLWLVSLVMLFGCFSWVIAEEVKLPADGDAWTEEKASWRVTAYRAGCKLNFSHSSEKENKKIGNASIRFNYRFKEFDKSYIILIRDPKGLHDISSCKYVKFWVYNPSPVETKLRLYLFTKTDKNAADLRGSSLSLNYRPYRTESLNFEGWKLFSFEIDSDYIAERGKGPGFNTRGFDYLQIYITNSKAVGDDKERYILIDNLRFHGEESTEVEVKGTEGDRVTIAKKVNIPLEIDGKLSDTCWKRVEKNTNFISTGGEKAEVQTISAFCYDDKSLYISFICNEPNMEMVKSKIKKRDGPVWTDDSIEIFLDTNYDRSGYFQFILNSVGTQFDRKAAQDFGISETSFNPYWERAISFTKDSWIVELAIPFKELGISRPVEGTVWGINLCRTRTQAASDKKHSSWQYVGEQFNNPERFGTLIFGSYEENLKKRLASVKEKLSITKEELTPEVKGLSEDAENELANLGKSASKPITKEEWVSLDKKIKKLSQKVARISLLGKKYIVWGKNAMDSRNPSPKGLPENIAISGLKELNIYTCLNEYESASFVISNFMDETLSGRVLISNLRSKEHKDVIIPDFITLRTPTFIKLRDGRIISDPLPKMNEINEFNIAPDGNKEIFLTIRPSDKLKPGTYEGFIDIRPYYGASPETIKLNLTIWPVRLSEKKALDISPWPYLFSNWEMNIGKCLPKERIELRDREYIMGDERAEACIKDMLEHGVSMFRTEQRPSQPLYDSNWNVIKPFKSDYNIPLKKYYQGRPILVNLSMGILPNVNKSRAQLRSPFEVGSPEWEKIFRIWIKAIVDRAHESGFSDDDIIIQPGDEPREEAAVLMYTVCKIVREMYPQIKMYSAVHALPPEFKCLQKLVPYIDYFVTNMNMCKAVKRDNDPNIAYLKKQGKKIWVYNNSLIENRATPGITCRLQAWFCWRQGLDGLMPAWAYNRYVGDPYDDTDVRGWNRPKGYSDCLFVYPGNEGPVTTRRWEGIREGVEDYEYLHLLKKAIEKGKKEGIDTSVAESLIKEAVHRVWDKRNPLDLDTVYKYRERIIKEVIKLQSL